MNITITQIIAKIIPNRDNNHVFLELFALKMIHLLSSHSFLLHFTINQVLWGTLQQNHKKAHYHVIYVANNPVTTDSVRHKIRKVLGDKSVAHVKIPVNIANYYLYLTHESKDAIQKKKQRYAKADIKLLNNFDIERYVTLSVEDKKDKLHLAIDLIRNYGCMNVIDLSFLIEKNPEFGLTRRELDDLTTQYASSLRLWFDGNYQISKRGGDLDNTLSEDFEDIGESVIAESDSGPEMTNENYKQLIAEKKAKHEAEMKALKETAKHSPRA